MEFKKWMKYFIVLPTIDNEQSSGLKVFQIATIQTWYRNNKVSTEISIIIASAYFPADALDDGNRHFIICCYFSAVSFKQSQQKQRVEHTWPWELARRLSLSQVDSNTVAIPTPIWTRCWLLALENAFAKSILRTWFKWPVPSRIFCQLHRHYSIIEMRSHL